MSNNNAISRIALGIEYFGANYSGWQRQAGQTTIQQTLEEALSKLANLNITITCAGRTDAGVHATGQVIHFDTNVSRLDIAWIRGVNSYLPRDIRVKWVSKVNNNFDARRSALSRRYIYYIYNNKDAGTAVINKGVTWVYKNLDADLMNTAAQYLIGEHDFSSFRAIDCQSNTPYRNIMSCEVKRVANSDLVYIDITANAFLHHMVRNITGSLIKVGAKEVEPIWIKQVLEYKDRTKAGVTAKPDGLYLVKVVYPNDFNLAENTNYPWFI